MTHHRWATRLGMVLPDLFGRAAVGVALIAVVACAPVYRNHGYIPSDDELALVEVGIDTRETVAVAVGRPSAADRKSVV